MGLHVQMVYMLSFKFILGVNFIFLLFLSMVMCDNEFETMENKIETKDTVEPQHICAIQFVFIVLCSSRYFSVASRLRDNQVFLWSNLP